jgi:hypothetical protein
MRFLFQMLSLSDRYKRRARLLPGLIVATPITLTAAAVTLGALPWYAAVGLTAGVELVLAFLLSHLARASGKALEEKMWAKWGGAPTTRWLRPDDTAHSEPQIATWKTSAPGMVARISRSHLLTSWPGQNTNARYGRPPAWASTAAMARTGGAGRGEQQKQSPFLLGIGFQEGLDPTREVNRSDPQLDPLGDRRLGGRAAVHVDGVGYVSDEGAFPRCAAHYVGRLPVRVNHPVEMAARQEERHMTDTQRQGRGR